MTPKQWVDATLGKSIDTDNYPRSNPYQCWDDFDFFCRKIGFDGSRYCGNTGYVGDLWFLRDVENYHYYTMFDYIYNPADFKDGDWVFWEKHVAMFMSPNTEVGQNQPYPYVTEKEMNWDGILGAMRYKYWQTYNVPYNYSIININGHDYKLQRMTQNDSIGVFAAGLNEVAPIEKLDADVLCLAKIGGANYYQMRTDLPDQPYGTTYGDLSAPLNGVYQTLPNQDSTLFYDLETGLFGDCTGVTIDSSHNVFSPSLVYPNSKGHWEYARMVGESHKDVKSWYCFVVRFTDGYATGKALQQMTPQEIANDFAETDMVNIAFLDGGGSAQAGFYYDGKMNYDTGDGRPLPSVVSIFRKFTNQAPVEPNVPTEPNIPTEPDTNNKEDETVNDKENIELKPIQDWKDPDAVNYELNPLTVILLNLANLFKVKSILTFAIVGAYIALLFIPREIPHFLETLVTMVVGVYFGTQIEKKSK